MDNYHPEPPPGAPAPGDDSQADRRGKPLRKVSVAAAGLGAAALVVAATGGVRWWTSPTLFEDGGPGGFSAHPQPMARATLYVGIAFPKADAPREQVMFSSARASLAPGSTEVTTWFSVCRNRHLEGTYGLGTSNTDKPEVFCSQVRPLEPGTTMTLNRDRDEYIVLTIRPERSGKAKLTAIDLTYSRGWGHLRQHGTQHLPQDIELVAS
jgi:hypothetical protein